MKKILSALFAALMLLTLFACQNIQNVSGKMSVVIAGNETVVYTVELDAIEINEGALSIFNYLKESEGLEFSVSGTGEYTYMTAIGSLKPNSEKSEFISIFTTVEKDFGVSAYVSTKSYDGRTLTTSGVGAFSMTIEENCIIYLCISTY